MNLMGHLNLVEFCLLVVLWPLAKSFLTFRKICPFGYLSSLSCVKRDHFAPSWLPQQPPKPIPAPLPGETAKSSESIPWIPPVSAAHGWWSVPRGSAWPSIYCPFGVSYSPLRCTLLPMGCRTEGYNPYLAGSLFQEADCSVRCTGPPLRRSPVHSKSVQRNDVSTPDSRQRKS